MEIKPFLSRVQMDLICKRGFGFHRFSSENGPSDAAAKTHNPSYSPSLSSKVSAFPHSTLHRISPSTTAFSTTDCVCLPSNFRPALYSLNIFPHINIQFTLFCESILLLWGLFRSEGEEGNHYNNDDECPPPPPPTDQVINCVSYFIVYSPPPCADCLLRSEVTTGCIYEAMDAGMVQFCSSVAYLLLASPRNSINTVFRRAGVYGFAGSNLKRAKFNYHDEDENVEMEQIGAERTKNVLILMSDTGGGHRASAEAIMHAFKLEFGDEYRSRPGGEVFVKWKGLDNVKEKEIVWPPMVTIINTQLDKDDKGKWIGM